MSDAERLIKMAEDAGDIVSGEDGFFVFWPTSNHGALNEWSLRALADELERRNAPWAARIAAELGAG